MARVLSGTRPTGKLHIGHLLGALENYKKLQGQDAFFMIADLHALTTEYENKTTIAQNVMEIVVDYLASGLDPEKCTMFVQSEILEHANLALLFSMITPISWLERNPTYKDQLSELKGKELHTHGFLGYPVLQAADIALYKAEKVPVGEDQLPHLELAREIIRRFHFLYKADVFPEPEAVMAKVTKLPGLDGRKMSKSYDNCIYLADSREEIIKKVKMMVTDPARKLKTDKGHPEICPVCIYHKIFNPVNYETIVDGCRNATRGCVDCKMELAGTLTAFLEPIREKRELWMKKKTEIRQILDQGARRAREVASNTYREALRAMGLAS